jgi:hypothetical protein
MVGQTLAIDWIRAIAGIRTRFMSVPPPRCTNGIFSMSINGQAGGNHAVQISTSLTSRLPVWTNSSARPPLSFSDTNITNSNRRFHRVLPGA